jgi:hypothetical protein
MPANPRLDRERHAARFWERGLQRENPQNPGK